MSLQKTLLTVGLSALFGLVSVDASAFTLRNAPHVESDYRMSGSDVLQDPLFAQAEPASTDLETKSTAKAVGLSLLLPGLGHQYLGESGRARGFFVTEGLLWTMFIVFQVQGNLREDGYQEYAGTFAGVSRNDHSDDFYALLTEYNTSDQYAYDVKDEGRFIFYPDVDTEFLEQYFVENRISDFEEWAWPSDEFRRTYQNQRAASKTAYRRSLYVVAVALANRAFAAFLAVKDTRDYNRSLQAQSQSFRLEFGAPRYHARDGFQTGVSIVRKF